MTLLIKSVHVLGSSRPHSERVDVFISGDKISAIGDFPNKPADEVIDGQGAFISPGFIDVDTTSDHYLTLFEDPGQEDFLSQGVTTIIGGQCGASLAPLLSGSLKSIERWADLNSINLNWHTLGELLSQFSKKPFGVNFGTFIGHTTVRMALTKDKRDLSINEIETIREVISKASKEGSFGVSFGLGHVHAKGVPYTELKALADTIKKTGGVYSAHLRKSGDSVMESLEEMFRLQKDTNVPILLTHFMPLKSSEAQYSKVLAAISSLPVDSNFHFAVPTSPVSTLPLYRFLPYWAQSMSFREMNEVLGNPHNHERILADMDQINAKDFVIAQAPKNDILSGKNLQELMKIFGQPTSKKALLKLMLTTKLRAIVHYKNLSQKVLTEAQRNQRSFISSHAPSFGPEKENFIKPERSTSTFTNFLKTAQKEKMDLNEVVRKLSYVPAKFLGLEGRGEVKEGYFADLTVFRGDSIKTVVVGGRVAWSDGEATGIKNGSILRHV